MKKLLYLLFCGICTHSYCTEQKDHLTAPTHGIAQVRIPGHRVRRDANHTWSFPVKFSDGQEINLNLKLTDGILIDSDTPVWFARGRGYGDDRIDYRPSNGFLRGLGNFSLYQDFENKAAVVVFHKHKTIEGFVKYYRFEEAAHCQSDTKTLLLKSTWQPPQSHPADLPNGKRDGWHTRKEKKRECVPEIVYPQILIQLDRADFQVNDLAAVRKMIAYWNAVDMLYSDVQKPQIKINIAGFIIPLDDYTAPWAANNTWMGSRSAFVQMFKALNSLGNYFATLRHQFPDNSYDFLFTFLSGPLNIKDNELGRAFLNVSCEERESRIAIIKQNDNTYITAAHELGHLLSCEHDEDMGCRSKAGIMRAVDLPNDQQLKWSSCSRSSFTEYFRGINSQCMNNCPSTIKHCEPALRCMRSNYKRYHIRMG